MSEYSFSEYNLSAEFSRNPFPLVELDRNEWERTVESIGQAGTTLIEENQISKWYKEVLPYARIPVVRNAGPCSTAYIVDTDRSVALAHFTPDITQEEIKRLLDGRQIKAGNILIPFPRSTVFVPNLFRKKIDFFQNLNLQPIIPAHIDKGMPVVANMAFHADMDRVIYGITYAENLNTYKELYKQSFQAS